MNFHPLVVHFPIVCLILYSTFEILSLFSRRLAAKLKTTKLILLYIGVSTGWLAIQTGEYAAELFGKTDLIEAHEEFGKRSYNTYLVIGVIYLLRLASEYYPTRLPYWLTNMLKHGFFHYFIAILAVAGMILLTITGSLGAAISHGPNADIVVETVYDLVMGE